MEDQEKRSKKKATSQNRRTSILKDVELEKENVTVKTASNGRRSLKRVSFADTTSIKEFLASRDPNYTEWHDTYEEPVVNYSSSIEVQQSLQAEDIFEAEVTVETKDQKKVLKDAPTLDSSVDGKSNDFGFFLDHMSKFLGTEAATSNPETISSEDMNFTCNVTGKISHREELTSTTMDITKGNMGRSDMSITQAVQGMTDKCKDLSSTNMEFTCVQEVVKDKTEVLLINEKNEASSKLHKHQLNTTCLDKSNINMSLTRAVENWVEGSKDSLNCDMSMTRVVPEIVSGLKNLIPSSSSTDGNSSSNSDLNISDKSVDDSVFESKTYPPDEYCSTKISNEDMEITCSLNMGDLLSTTVQPSALNIDPDEEILEKFRKGIFPDTSKNISAMDKSLHIGDVGVKSYPVDVLLNKTETITMHLTLEDCSRESDSNPSEFLIRSHDPDIERNCSAMTSQAGLESEYLDCTQPSKVVHSSHDLQTSIGSKTAKITETEHISVLKDEVSPPTLCFNIEALNPHENVPVPQKQVPSKCLASNLSAINVKSDSEENVKSSLNENYDCDKILSPLDPSGLAAFEQENFETVTDQEPGLPENRIDSLLTGPITNRENHDISISLICEDVPYAMSKSAMEKNSRIEILNADLQMNKSDLSIRKDVVKDRSILPNTPSVFSPEMKGNRIEDKLASMVSENVSLLKSDLDDNSIANLLESGSLCAMDFEESHKSFTNSRKRPSGDSLPEMKGNRTEDKLASMVSENVSLLKSDLDDNSKANLLESGSLCAMDFEESHKSFTNSRKRPSGDSLPCDQSAKMMHLEPDATQPAFVETEVSRESSNLNGSNTTHSLENIGNDSPKLKDSDELINEMSFDLVEDLTETSHTSDTVSPKENEVAVQSNDNLKSVVNQAIQDFQELASTDLKFLSLDSFIKKSPMNIDVTEDLSLDKDDEGQSVIETNESILEEEAVEQDESIHMEDDESHGENKLPCVQNVSENVEHRSLENLEKSSEILDNDFCITCRRLEKKKTKIYCFIVECARDGWIQLGLPGRPLKLYLDIIIHNSQNVIGRADWGPKDKDLKTPIAVLAYKTFGHCVSAKMDSLAGLELCKINEALHEIVLAYETMMSFLRELFLIQSFFIVNFEEEGLLKVILPNAKAHLCISLRVALPSNSFSTEDLLFNIEPKVEIGNLRTETLETALDSVEKGPCQLLRTIRCVDHVVQNMS